MKKLIIASNNKKKIKELKAIVENLGWDVKSLADENIDIEVEEDGLTFEANAEKKAREIYDFLIKRGDKNFAVLSDDSGLEVDCLNGAPGVYSARYAGEHGNDAANNKKLLEELKNVKGEDRRGRFVCAIALIDTNGNSNIVRGTVEGLIKEELNGEGGFGYDPLFYYEPANMTFAELEASEKNKISHRANALKKIEEYLK
ncbi:XTP/dITP diphosphatase [Clostridium sp. NSJ-49]|uniref:XTP/dITP diphosphatase n=1 Tax=Clostridium TaxID=1485 RepID=UPI00164A50D0|nr:MULTISPECIES: XTP/dITP diphosphatase [unclassified Clostridium]MBC5626924.1 XTP/dITP diphosphatase [Clostridium sp. NSJ-49]MCD2503247.1 XTP/dITP diphosphatase [Clostridium sp. NSJ-145]